jgi:hypothetical protein
MGIRFLIMKYRTIAKTNSGGEVSRMSKRGLTIFLVLVCMSAASTAMAVTVSGKVSVDSTFRKSLVDAEQAKAKQGNRPYHWNVPNGILAVKSPRVKLNSDIAVVVSKPGTPAPNPEKLRTVKVHAGAMEANVIVTRPGSTLRFRNVDPYDHELYSPQMAGFKAERQSNGSFRPIEFKTEGVFEVRCKLMPHFRAHVVVTKAYRMAAVKSDGSFALDAMEPGKYTLKVFYGGQWIHKQTFTISAKQRRELKVDVKLKPGGAKAGKPSSGQ